MTSREPELRRIEAAFRSLPKPMTPRELAEARIRNGTAVLQDLRTLGFEAELREQLPQHLINLSMPYRRARAAGKIIRSNWYPGDVLGHLISFRPEEKPDEAVVARVREGLIPREQILELLSINHYHFLAARLAMGADDGLPLRQAMADGVHGEDAAMLEPPSGAGYARCPMECPMGGRPERCGCFGYPGENSWHQPLEYPEPPRSRSAEERRKET